MKYSFLNIAAAASAALAVATIALTLRSFSGDKWETLGPTSTTILLYSGAVHYETHAYSSAHLVAINNGYAQLSSDTRADGEFDAEIPISPWTHSAVPAGQYKPGLENLGFDYISITNTTRAAPSSATRQTLTAKMASAAAGANKRDGGPGTINIDRKFLLVIPLWLPFLLFSALPLYAIRHNKHQTRRASRRERRRQAKILPTHCHACNAELVGLPYLCPHCGTPISSKSAAPKTQILRPQ